MRFLLLLLISFLSAWRWRRKGTVADVFSGCASWTSRRRSPSGSCTSRRRSATSGRRSTRCVPSAFSCPFLLTLILIPTGHRDKVPHRKGGARRARQPAGGPVSQPLASGLLRAVYYLSSAYLIHSNPSTFLSSLRSPGPDRCPSESRAPTRVSASVSMETRRSPLPVPVHAPFAATRRPHLRAHPHALSRTDHTDRLRPHLGVGATRASAHITHVDAMLSPRAAVTHRSRPLAPLRCGPYACCDRWGIHTYQAATPSWAEGARVWLPAHAHPVVAVGR